MTDGLDRLDDAVRRLRDDLHEFMETGDYEQRFDDLERRLRDIEEWVAGSKAIVKDRERQAHASDRRRDWVIAIVSTAGSVLGTLLTVKMLGLL